MEIYPVSNGWSAAYLVVDGSVAMLVDASTPEIAPVVLAKLAEVHAQLRLIVLTHFHFDHVGAADALRAATGARIAIHHADAAALRAGGPLHLHATSAPARLLVHKFAGGDNPRVLPDIELADTEDLTQFGGIGRSFATPGHTLGSISVLLPDGTVLTGDAITAAPIGHHAAGPIFADDKAASRRSVAAIASSTRGDVRIAHGGLLDRASVDRLAAHDAAHH